MQIINCNVHGTDVLEVTNKGDFVMIGTRRDYDENFEEDARVVALKRSSLVVLRNELNKLLGE